MVAKHRTEWDDTDRRPCYQVYGLSFTSNFPFKNRLAQANAQPRLAFVCRAHTSEPELPSGAEYVYESPFEVDSGASNYYLYRLPDGYLMRFTDVADFFVRPHDIECRVIDSDALHIVEILFLGIVLSFVLEINEIMALHGAAVVVGSSAVAFLADNKGGKSSLAAGLMQKGYRLLSDDILSVRCSAESCTADPGYPQMRLWPDQAEHFVGDFRRLDLVDPAISKRMVAVGPGAFGLFCDQPKPLKAIYLPARRSDDDPNVDVEIERISQGEALIHLVQHSFIPRTIEAMYWQPRRLERFAALLTKVSVRRLSYPSGLVHLPRVCETILEDLAGVDERG